MNINTQHVLRIKSNDRRLISQGFNRFYQGVFPNKFVHGLTTAMQHQFHIATPVQKT